MTRKLYLLTGHMMHPTYVLATDPTTAERLFRAQNPDFGQVDKIEVIARDTRLLIQPEGGAS